MRQLSSTELRQARAGVLRDAEKLSAKGKLTSLERREFDALMREADDFKRQYEQLESRAMAGFRGGAVDGGPERGDPKSQEHRDAFGSYLRRGLQAMDPEQRSVLAEHRDMGSGGQGAYPGATAGFFVPVGFVQDVISAMKFVGPMMDEKYIDLMETESGAPLPYPTDNDTTVTGERVAEGAQVTSQDVSLGQILLGSYKYSTKLVKVSLELLQDSAFDMEKYLIQKFALRLGRILNADFTVGTGAANSQPLGVVTSTLASGNLVPAVGSSSNDGTAAGTNTIGSDDLINLEHSIDPLYRPNACYMMHDSTLKKFKQVKDKYGRPLWQPSLVAGTPDSFNGRPLLINNAMDTLQTNAGSPPVTRNAVVFGDLKRYIVRRVRAMSVLRLEERFADMGQVAFLGFARYDGTPAYAGTGNAFPFALLQNTY